MGRDYYHRLKGGPFDGTYVGIPADRQTYVMRGEVYERRIKKAKTKSGNERTYSEFHWRGW